jgi:hypothetical protein
MCGKSCHVSTSRTPHKHKVVQHLEKAINFICVLMRLEIGDQPLTNSMNFEIGELGQI